jgi:hypothetical protein
VRKKPESSSIPSQGWHPALGIPIFPKKLHLYQKGTPAMDFFKDLAKFLWERKLWWLLPVILVLLVFGTLLIVSSFSPAAAPFIYSLF